MSILNKPICGGSDSTFNIGTLLCDIIHGKISGLIFSDPGFKFTAAQLVSQDAFMTAATAATRAARGSRIYPLWDITNVEDTTQEPQKANIVNNTTAQITMQDAIPSFDFQHRKGMLFHQQLAAAANLNLPVFIVDDKNQVFGVKTQAGEFVGFSVTEFYAGIRRFGTATTPSYYPFSVTFASAREHKEAEGAVISDARIKSLTGLITVNLEVVQASGNTVKLKATSIDNMDISESYDTELTQATAWVVKDSTGTTATVSPAYNSADKTHILTLSGAAWTGAAVGDTFTATLADPATLAAAPINMDGYDGNTASFNKPA